MRTLSVVLIAVMLSGCGQKPVSYRTQVQPILDNRCATCHSAERHRGKVVLASYATLMNSRPAVSGKQQLVVPGNPKESRLFVLCATTQPHFRMPPDTTSLPPVPTADLELLMKWISQGARDN